MSRTASAPSRGDGNNTTIQTSQNKAKLLEATMRNVPKLKELNYTHWKNVITNSIKNAKLWGYVDGSIEQPLEENNTDLAKYFDEAGAVRNAILGSLESGAQKYIEEALDPRDAWLTLEKKYLTAEAETDADLVSIEKELNDLKFEEGGDIIEHIAAFCRMRSHVNGTRFALDDQASITMLYRSLPQNLRQSVLTSDATEMRDFSALCARLSYLSQNPPAEDSSPPVIAEDHTNWGVPEDIKAFGLTGDRNPLLEERAAVTCRDCLLKGHKAGTPECPQYEWRKELWGMESNEGSENISGLGNGFSTKRPIPVNSTRLSYEFSEPVKVVLDFNDLGLRDDIKDKLRSFCPRPSAIQQCAILPIISGRNVLAQAPRGNGKSTALVASILQIINPSVPLVQALVFTPTVQAATNIQSTFSKFGNSWGEACYCYDPSKSIGEADLGTLARNNRYQIAVSTPGHLLGLIHRKILKTHNLKILAMDDVDKILETESDEQIFEVYQHAPPLAQIVASSTNLALSVTKTVAKLLVDPIRITVNCDKGIFMRAPHFFVEVPVEQKSTALLALYSSLSVKKAFILCGDIARSGIKGNDWSNYFYYLEKSMDRGSRHGIIQQFEQWYRSSSGYRTALVADDATFPIDGLVKSDIPLVNYDVPNDVEGYDKRLSGWREANPEQRNMIITFVTPGTNEMQILHDFEKRHGVEIAELLWNGRMIH